MGLGKKILLLSIFISVGNVYSNEKPSFLRAKGRAVWLRVMSQKYPKSIVYKGKTDKKIVALTFDDGPDDVVTPKVLDILKRFKIKATFFFLGKQIEKNPAVVRRAQREGHLVLNHSWSHPRLSEVTNNQFIDEIKKTEKALSRLIGPRPLLMRPPHGDVNRNIFHQLKNLGYKIVMWSLDTMDWKAKESSAISDKVLSEIHPGAIVLMHSQGDKMLTANSLPVMIKGLKAKGYRFATVDRLLKLS